MSFLFERRQWEVDRRPDRKDKKKRKRKIKVSSLTSCLLHPFHPKTKPAWRLFPPFLFVRLISTLPGHGEQRKGTGTRSCVSRAWDLGAGIHNTNTGCDFWAAAEAGVLGEGSPPHVLGQRQGQIRGQEVTSNFPGREQSSGGLRLWAIPGREAAPIFQTVWEGSLPSLAAQW